jgi:hypothetical protein
MSRPNLTILPFLLRLLQVLPELKVCLAAGAEIQPVLKSDNVSTKTMILLFYVSSSNLFVKYLLLFH